MKNLKDLCEKLCIPKIITEEVIEFDKSFNYKSVEDSMNKLFSRETWDNGRLELIEALQEDKNGIKILSCMLRCGLKTYENYIKLGIDERIYIDTLKCFTRFINEHYISYGSYKFDRHWWTSRQVAMQLFRIGELEYEMKNIDKEYIISIHIPSDAIITQGNLRESYDKAREFFSRYFPQYRQAKMICNSWLLSPNLNKILNEDSRILRFQKSFVITSVDIIPKEYMEWIFKKTNIPICDLPEDTTLQRNLKQYLLDGNELGEACGYLVNNPFL